MSTVVEFKNLTKIFPHPSNFEVLRGINLDIKENEFCCLVGPSGCGKSTLLSILAGFETITSGSLLVEGETISKPGPDRAVVFQEGALFPWLTVYKNVEMGLKIAGVPVEERKEKVLKYLEYVGLENFQNHLPSELSGGMKQRVSIARVLVLEPRMLLMDEPFGALDAQTRGQMHELLIGLWEKIECSILFITHDVEEAVLLGDKVNIMSARPGMIHKTIDIDLERPRDRSIITTNRFNELRSEILEDLQSL